MVGYTCKDVNTYTRIDQDPRCRFHIYIYIHDYIHTGTQFHRLYDVHSDAHSTLVFFCPFTVPCWTNMCGTCWHKTYWTKLQRLELLRLFRSMISWKWIRIVCDHFQNLADNPNGDVADAPLADLKHLEASRSISNLETLSSRPLSLLYSSCRGPKLLTPPEPAESIKVSQSVSLTWIICFSLFFPAAAHKSHNFCLVFITICLCKNLDHLHRLPCRPKEGYIQAPKE